MDNHAQSSYGYGKGCKHGCVMYLWLIEDVKMSWQYCQLILFCFKDVALLLNTLQNKESIKEMLLLQLLLTNYVSRLPLVELNIHLLGWTRIPLTSCLELSRTGQPGLVELQVLRFSSVKFETGAVLCSSMRVVTVVSKVSCGSCKEITATYKIGGRTSVNQLYSFKYKCVCCFFEMTLFL